MQHCGSTGRMTDDSPSKLTLVKCACLAVCISVWGIIFTAGCSTTVKVPNPTREALFNSPIPEATLQAYRSGAPILEPREAITAARVSLLSTRLRSTQTPQVKSVERMQLAAARKRVAPPDGYSYEDRPGDTQVWFVVFEGEWQVVPPMRDASPRPLANGCVYVILNASDGGRGEVGGVKCPSE